jgi:hypothetical protein
MGELKPPPFLKILKKQTINNNMGKGTKRTNLSIWDVKELKNGNITLEFSNTKIPIWMNEFGFQMVCTISESGDKNYVLIRINKKDKTVTIIKNSDEFKDWMSTHFKNTSNTQFGLGGIYHTCDSKGNDIPFIKDKVLGLIMKSAKTVCDNIINHNKTFITPFNKEFLCDSKGEVFLNFANGVVKVTQSETTFLDSKLLKNKFRYLDSLIHKNPQIQNFSGNIDLNPTIGESNFELFCKMATSKKINNNLTSKPIYGVDYVYSDDDMKTLMSGIGYLCSNYKEGGKSKLVLLQDRYMDNNSRQGRNGKTVVANTILRFIKGVMIAADKVDLKDQFAFNNVNYGDKIIFFDEILPKKKFIETLFNEVNGFLNVRKLHQSTFTLSGQNLPKFLGCSNFMVWNPKELSQSERIHCVEFSDFFNKAVMYGGDITDYFGGKWIFDDMDDMEWNKFFNFIIRCIQLFLSNGFYKHPNPLYKSNTSILIQHFTSVDKSILNWIDDYLKTERVNGKHYDKDFAPFRDVLFEKMKSTVGSQIVSMSGLDETKFAQLLLDVCNLLGYEFNPSQKHNGNKMNDRKIQRRDLVTNKVKYVIHIVHPTELS